MLKKFFILVVVFKLVFVTGIFAVDVDFILENVKKQIDKVNTMKAFYSQKSIFNFQGTKKSIEKGIIYRKKDKLKKQVQYPEEKIIIQTPDFYYEKNIKTGKEKKIDYTTQEHKPLNFDEVMNEVNFNLKNENSLNYILEGEFQKNKVLITVDKKHFLVTNMKVFANDKLIMNLQNIFKKINGLYVVVKVKVDSNINVGKQSLKMNMETMFIKPKIGIKIDDEEFEI